jgi:hypothetical protein
MGEAVPAVREARFWAGAEEATTFFMGRAWRDEDDEPWQAAQVRDPE